MTEKAENDLRRDLVKRLGFGDNITEPMADNDTIVAWFEQQSRDANEWQEHELWRNDCYAAGHPDDEDCWEHDPTLRLVRAEARLAAAEAVAARWADVLAECKQADPRWILDQSVTTLDSTLTELRRALDEPRFPPGDPA